MGKVIKFQKEKDIQSITWAARVKAALKGKTIADVRYLTDAEMKHMMWYNKAVVIIFTDGTYMFPSSDDEGNSAGALFTNIVGLETIPVI